MAVRQGGGRCRAPHLPMQVSADLDGCLELEQHGLVHEDLAGSRAQIAAARRRGLESGQLFRGGRLRLRGSGAGRTQWAGGERASAHISASVRLTCLPGRDPRTSSSLPITASICDARERCEHVGGKAPWRLVCLAARLATSQAVQAGTSGLELLVAGMLLDAAAMRQARPRRNRRGGALAGHTTALEARASSFLLRRWSHERGRLGW